MIDLSSIAIGAAFAFVSNALITSLSGAVSDRRGMSDRFSRLENRVTALETDSTHREKVVDQLSERMDSLLSKVNEIYLILSKRPSRVKK